MRLQTSLVGLHQGIEQFCDIDNVFCDGEDHLSATYGNAGEFDSRQKNVGEIDEKSWKCRGKSHKAHLFIVSFMLVLLCSTVVV